MKTGYRKACFLLEPAGTGYMPSVDISRAWPSIPPYSWKVRGLESGVTDEALGGWKRSL